MSFEKLKKNCKENGSAVMASMKMNGDVFIYVNPEASDEQISKSMMVLSVNVIKHIKDIKG